MDVAALALNIDSTPVVKASNDLDNFAKSSDRASAAASKFSRTGSIAKIAQDYDRAAKAADMASSASTRAASAVSSANSTLATSSSKVSKAVADADSHIVAYRSHLASLPAAANSAASSIGGVTRAANDNANAMRANTGNIAAQFQDIGVTAAMGMSPLLIALQQGTQLSAVFAASGGTAFASIKAAIASVLSPVSLLTIGIVALIAYVVQLGIEFLTASEKSDTLTKSLDTAVFSTYALNDAQGILSNVFDLTTGKIINQSGALRDLAQAQLLAAQAESARNLMENTSYLGAYSRVKKATGGGLVAGQVLSGQANPKDAMNLLSALYNNGKGKLGGQDYVDLLGRISGVGLEKENQKVIADALKSLESGTLSSQFRRGGSSASKGRGGKSDADRLADILRTANEAIVAEQNRAKATEMSALVTAEFEQKTKMLNAASAAGLKITPALAETIDKLSKAYGEAKIAADVAEVVKASTDEIDKQREAVADQVKLVGLYGDQLARARRELEAQKRLRDALPKGEIIVTGNLTGGLSDEIEAANRAQRMEDIRKDAADAAYSMDIERQGLILTGQAAIEYAYITERLNKARREGIDLSPAEIDAIRAAGAAYAQTRYEIDQQAQSIADVKEVARGFFSDLSNGLREGGNAFKAFADAATNALNRVIDKLLDKALNSFLNSFFASQGGGGGGGGASSSQSSAITAALSSFGFANGGVFDRALRFAKGGTFTNSVVTSPTLFRFAKGSKIGEMGEAGPEAVMPLTRGPDGRLGVQAHGGGGGRGDVNIYNEYRVEGAVTPDMILSMIRQGGEATYDQVRRDLKALLDQLDRDGAMV